MTVNEFNIQKGLYIFSFNEIGTEFHSHPAIEIIIAETGVFSVWTATDSYNNLKFSIIPANFRHKLSSANCDLKVIMIEHHNTTVAENMKRGGVDFSNGYFLQSVPDRLIVQTQLVIKKISSKQVSNDYDYRIAEVIKYLNEHDLEYDLMMKTLRTITNLSESRLSHLFKSTIGISLKKYLIWSKLKSAVKSYLGSKDDLFSALMKSGFYDQPHFSKSFKNMLGVNPSKVYNSRTLQDFSGSTH